MPLCLAYMNQDQNQKLHVHTNTPDKTRPALQLSAPWAGLSPAACGARLECLLAVRNGAVVANSLSPALGDATGTLFTAAITQVTMT
jgi:hypothetical protein